MDQLDKYQVVIVGAGLSGAVLAERLASQQGKKVLIIERRPHTGGNCYDYREPRSGLMVSKYGPHLFHTNDREVWDYVNGFDDWVRWEHQVRAYVDGQYVPVPVNMTTINRLCQEHLQTPEDTKKWLDEQNPEQISKNIGHPKSNYENSRDVALGRVGPTLYKKLFENYTYKQWAKLPEELDSSILARIPVRTDCDSRYFSDRYQGLPHQGYTHFFEQLLSNPLIDVEIETDYFDPIVKEAIDTWRKDDDSNSQSDSDNHPKRILIFTGPIDQYYADIGYPKLEYRSLRFEMEYYPGAHYYQPLLQVNYPSLTYPFTRIVEYKHLPYNTSESTGTIIVKEFSTDQGEPYYPVLTEHNLELYQTYQQLAKQEQSNSVHFVGRLANFKYFNMDQAIRNALNYYQDYFET